MSIFASSDKNSNVARSLRDKFNAYTCNTIDYFYCLTNLY